MGVIHRLSGHGIVLFDTPPLDPLPRDALIYSIMPHCDTRPIVLKGRIWIASIPKY